VIGAVLCDAAGNFCGRHAQWHPHGLDALTMEALAIRDRMALSRGVQRQHLETDCHDFVKFCEVAVGSMIFFLLLYPLFQVTLYLSMFRSTMFLSCLGYSLSEIGK